MYIPSQLGNPKNSNSHSAHLSPIMWLLQAHFPSVSVQVLSTAPSSLHSHSNWLKHKQITYISWLCKSITKQGKYKIWICNISQWLHIVVGSCPKIKQWGQPASRPAQASKNWHFSDHFVPFLSLLIWNVNQQKF